MRAGRRGAPGRAASRLLAALWIGVAGAASAEEPPATAAPGYQAVDPGERQGRTLEPGDRSAPTREPGFEGRSVDPGERPGASRELRELARPPGPDPAAQAPDETDGPTFLRLPHRPGEGPAPDAPLAERLCAAERDLEHALREERQAIRDYKRALRDSYPRGAAKALVVERRDLTGRLRQRAEAEKAALLAEADEGGVELDPAVCADPE